jgi:beta-glucosidase
MRQTDAHSSGVSRRKMLGTLGGVAAAAALTPTRAAAAAAQKRTAAEFPKDFAWGAATSAHQIEGALNEDGRGASVWDAFCKKPGAIWRGQSAEMACDHYHRYRDDVGLMKSMGLRAYRFSISWTRVLPDGTGKVNEAGLAFYQRLVDELLRAGITPYLTLHHWDFPLALHERGGWMNRDSADWFAQYATVLTRALSDRVTHWLTINEPQDLIGSGYITGVHAPGEKLPLGAALCAGHNALRAHGKSVQAIRANAKRAVRIGFPPVGVHAIPATDSEADIAAARRATFSAGRDTWNSAWWMDPVFLGRYPEDGLAALGSDAPEVQSGDMETIRQPLEFCGINVYAGRVVRAGADGAPEPVPPAVGEPLTAFDWPVTPPALYWAPRWFHERYKLPILITENGLTCRDWISLDGGVHDAQRIDFVARYLRELHRAIAEGVPVQGYFHWTLLDNFEWAQGYKHRFGLVFVDFPTQRRILKDSARWYARLIASNGKTLAEPWRPV